MATVLPASVLALAPASAAPLPAAYSARAHADIVDLDVDVDVDVPSADIAGVQVGHSLSTVDSTSTDGASTATSANLGVSLVGTGLTPDEQTATAPPSQDPPAGTLAGAHLGPAVTVGALEGDTQAAWAGPNACVPADAAGNRVLSDSRTTLAGLTLASFPGLGVLAEVKASETRTRTFLDDTGAGGSDVVSRASTTVGDISLLGGAVTVDVTNPVVLQARSDGTDGSAGYLNPPTVVATVGGQRIPIPTDGRPAPIALPVLLDPLVDLSITAYPATDQSSDPTGRATVDAVLRIDLEVFGAADVTLDIAPMTVEATAPTGGVDCGAVDDDAPTPPVIETPAEGAVTNDATPEFSGTAEPGSTVVVKDAHGLVVCSDVADHDTGAWSCTPSQPLPHGVHTYTATATDDANNTSPADTVTFTIDTTAPAVDVLTPANGSTTTEPFPVVSGRGEAGASVRVTEHGVLVCSATVDSTGAWSCTPTVPFALGSHTLVVTATDAAGNTATDTTTFTVVPGAGDTVPPAAPNITSPTQGASVHDPTPLITGTGEPGATVTVTEGSTTLCTAVVRGDGTWSCSSAVRLPLGPHTVSATQTDPSGNTSTADTVTFTVVAGPGDTDGDGLPDQQDGSAGTDPNGVDTDNDGLSDGPEVNTTGTNPLDADTDDDGLTDGSEVDVHRTDPNDRDTDGDGLGDGNEVAGVQVHQKFDVCWEKTRKVITVTTDPLHQDTDEDGLSDGNEVRGYKIKQKVKAKNTTFVIGKTRSNPTRKDSDRDGLDDAVEVTGKANKRWGKDKTDPTKCDTDNGGVRDGAEVRAKSNPANWRSGPSDPRIRNGRTTPGADLLGVG